MIRFKAGLVVIITGVFLTCFLSLSRAEFTLTPSISVQEEYNDNIFLTPTDKKDDFITSVSPALSLTYKASIVTLALNVGPNFVFYAKNHDQDQTNIADTQTAKLDTTFSLYKDIFFIKVFDQYQRVPVNATKQEALGNYFVNLTNSNSLLISPYFEFPLSGSTKAKVGYKYDNQWFDTGDNSYDQDGFAGISSALGSNINASINYDYLVLRLWGRQAVQLSDNYDEQTVSLPVVYKPGPRISLNGSIGETWFKYENGMNANNPATIWNAGATYQLTSRVSLSASYSKSYLYPGETTGSPTATNVPAASNVPSASGLPTLPTLPAALSASYGQSVESGNYEAETAQGTISYNGKIPVSVTINKTTDTYIVVGSKIESSGITINSSLPISPKLTGSITGSYNYVKSNSGNELLSGFENEKENRYIAGLSLAYQMKITTLALGYTYNRNYSTIATDDYTNNIVYVRATFPL